MVEKQPETSFDVLIDKIFEDGCRMKINNGLNFIKDWCKRDPKTFENHFRNLNNFIETKVFNMRKQKKEKAGQVRVNYL